MCGISGIVQTRGGQVDNDQLHAMIGTLRHRGPDASGTQICGPAGLAHARLSIIDLAGGAQPMRSADAPLWITFNGEIFNYIELRDALTKKGHRFTTRSDTEVILQAYQEYGEDCVRYFNGQWAFAIWDEIQQKLFLSRDRLGVRPLFYTRTPDSFLFASEIKALFACPQIPRELDLVALDQIFTFWVTLPPRTAFKGISQLPPGHSLTLQDGKTVITEYWKLEYAPETPAEDERKRAEELLDLLLDATTIRLRSDVPVGAYLSGGIDSSVITALITQSAANRLRTFSVTFDDQEFDESAYQQEASTFLRTQHSAVRCTRGDIGSAFPQVIWHAEQPILRTAPSPLYLLSRHVRESQFKVVLTGEGADEMLGGYDILKETKIRSFWGRQIHSAWRPLLLKRLYPYMENIQRQSPAYLKGFFHVTAEDLASPFFSHLPRWELTAKLKVLFSDAVRSELVQHDAVSQLTSALPSRYFGWPAFHRAEYLEAMYLLPGYILSSQGDRMAMAHGVEGRYPFLDHRVVEFAARLSPSLKMKVLDQKHLLKVASGKLIPDSIRRRPKQPYRAPDGACFFGAATPDYVEELLGPERIGQDGIFDPVSVHALVNKFKRGRVVGVKDNMALVGILSTQLLLDQFVHGRKENTCRQISEAKSVASS